MARSFLVNAVDVALALPVATPDSTITVDDGSALPAVPFYLVVDPFSDTDGREYMLCTNVAANVLTVDRNLGGTESTTHPSGDIVRITWMAQHLDDLWDGLEAVPPPGLPLPSGGVLGDSVRKLSAIDGDAVFRSNVFFDTTEPAAPILGDFWMNPDETGPPGGYLPLAGGTMSGEINMAQNALFGLLDPVFPEDAVHKAYVDGQDHHARYTDTEAIDAVGPHTPPFVPSNLHADLTDVSADQHHVRYTDAEAIAAVGDPGIGVYLPLAGGTLNGDQVLSTKLVRNITVGATEPVGPVIGDVWIDTT